MPNTTPKVPADDRINYDALTKTTDDGRNWHPLKPTPTDAPDEDRNWNALSLPFVVGPHGRIATLRPSALQPQPSKP